MVSSWVCWASMPVFEIHRERIMASPSGCGCVSSTTAAARRPSRRPPRSAASSSAPRTGAPRRSSRPSFRPALTLMPSSAPSCTRAFGSAGKLAVGGAEQAVGAARQRRLGRDELQLADRRAACRSRALRADGAVGADADLAVRRHLDRPAVAEHGEAAARRPACRRPTRRARRRGCRPRCRPAPARRASRCPSSRRRGCGRWPSTLPGAGVVAGRAFERIDARARAVALHRHRAKRLRARRESRRSRRSPGCWRACPGAACVAFAPDIDR